MTRLLFCCQKKFHISTFITWCIWRNGIKLNVLCLGCPFMTIDFYRLHIIYRRNDARALMFYVVVLYCIVYVLFHNIDWSRLVYRNGREDFLLRSRKILDVLFWKGSFCAPPNSIGHRLKIHETWIFLLLVFLVDIKIIGMTSYFLETLSLDFCKMLRSTSHTKISFLI